MALDRGTTFTWYGHSCWEVTTPGGRTIIFDPWFGNPASPKSADRVEKCDLLLVSHGHADHFGDALLIGSRTRPIWPCIHELSLWLEMELEGSGVEIIGMNKGGTVETHGIKVTMVHADHSAGDWSGAGEGPLYMGEPVGFVLALEDGRRVYYSGDTELFGDMALIGEMYKPAIAFLPIGDLYTMGPEQAARACELLGVKQVVPMHYGTFPALTGTPAKLRELVEPRGVQVLELKPGETAS